MTVTRLARAAAIVALFGLVSRLLGYVREAVLAGVYGSTLLRWLADRSEDDAPTLAFLDRRLADVARIGRLRRRVKEGLRAFRPRGAV